MLLKTLKLSSTLKHFQFHIQKASRSGIGYEIPEVYRNCFYLANAQFFDSTRWFLHRAYEVVFSDLVEELKDREPSFTDEQAQNKIRNLIEILDSENIVVDVHYPIKLKDGNFSLIQGYRTHHGQYKNNNPCLGGFRICPEFTKDHAKALAALSTYQYACMGIDMVGSSGGLKTDFKNFTEDDHKAIIEMYIAELARRNLYGQNTDNIQPDFTTGSKEMSLIARTDLSTFGLRCENKPLALGIDGDSGGVSSYERAGSHCVRVGLEWFLKHKDVAEKLKLTGGLENKTFIIQGIGRLGGNIGLCLEEHGAKCIGVKEIDAYVYFPAGIKMSEILEHKKKTGSIQNFNLKTKPYDKYEILGEECDILVIAASQKNVTCYIADKVKAKVIVEAAHGGLTPTAHKILVGHGSRLVLPDIYINAGYSLAAYYEYLKHTQYLGSRGFQRGYAKEIFRDLILNVQQLTASDSGQLALKLQTTNQVSEEQLLIKSLDYIMEQTARDIFKIAEKYSLGFDLRTAAYIKAIKNIFGMIFDAKGY